MSDSADRSATPVEQEVRIVSLLRSGAPKIVVLLGEPVFRLAPALLEPAGSNAIPQVLKSHDLSEYIRGCSAAGRDAADCVICMHLSGLTDNPDELLGTACRASPRLVIAEHSSHDETEQTVNDEQFFAFGFRLLGRSEHAGGHSSWYAFSLSDYKQAPDWLNARFWAHPERFDLLD